VLLAVKGSEIREDTAEVMHASMMNQFQVDHDQVAWQLMYRKLIKVRTAAN
jgi:hypothetical protein